MVNGLYTRCGSWILSTLVTGQHFLPSSEATDTESIALVSVHDITFANQVNFRATCFQSKLLCHNKQGIALDAACFLTIVIDGTIISHVRNAALNSLLKMGGDLNQNWVAHERIDLKPYLIDEGTVLSDICL